MDRFALSFPKAGLSALLAVLGAGSGVAVAVTDAERIQTYQEFRSAFDAGRYADALPIAEKLVTLTEQQLGPEDKALINPLSNLGTAQFRLENYAAAETAYQRALSIAEARATSGADPAQIRPLHGLGEVLLATKRYEAAVVSLDRAIDLTRNLRGLYDESQLAILPSLIDCYAAMQNYALAEKEHQYAFRVAETAYGRADKRLLGPIDSYARWYEFVGRYTTARVLHARGLQIAEQAAGRNSLLAVRPLRGLSRTYWLEFLNGPEETAEQSAPQDAAGNAINTTGRLNPDGEKALQLAIATINKEQPDNHADLGETLIDLGNWYLISGSLSKSSDAYRLAFQQLEKAGSAQRLATPAQLTYRPTTLSTLRYRPEKPEEFTMHTVDARLAVSADGRVKDATLVSSDAPEASVKAVLAALKRARYRPRLETSGPVEAAEVPYTEKVYVRIAAQPAAKSP